MQKICAMIRVQGKLRQTSSARDNGGILSCDTTGSGRCDQLEEASGPVVLALHSDLPGQHARLKLSHTQSCDLSETSQLRVG